MIAADPTPPTPSPGPGAEPEPEPPEQSELRRTLATAPIMRLVGLAGQAVGNSFRRAFAEEDGLSPGAASVLLALAYGQGRALASGPPRRATHSELAQRCMITPATLTGIVSTLEKAGYVRRERDQADRRVVWLVLTEPGETRARQIGARVSAANTEMMKHLTPEHERALRGFLLAVIENNLNVLEDPELTQPQPDCGPPAEDSSLESQRRPGRPRC